MLLRLARRARAKALHVQKARAYRKFHIEISPEWYATLNSDVGQSNIDPLTHFLEHGISEGRALPVAFGSYWVPEFKTEEKVFRIVSENSGNSEVSVFIDCGDMSRDENLERFLEIPKISINLIGDARKVLKIARKNNFSIEQIESQNFFDLCKEYFLFVRIGDDFASAVEALHASIENSPTRTPIQFPLRGQGSTRSIIGHSYINSRSHCALVTIDSARIGHNLPRRIFGTTLRGTAIPRSYGIYNLGPDLQLVDIVQSWNEHSWRMKFEGKSHITVGSESIISGLALPNDDLRPCLLIEMPDEISRLIPRMRFSSNISTTKFSDSPILLIAPQDRFSELPWDSLVDRVVTDLGVLGIQVVPTDGREADFIGNAQIHFYSEFDFSRRLLPTGSDTQKLFVVKQGVCKCPEPDCENVNYQKSKKTVSQKWRDTSPSNQVIFVSCNADSENQHDLITALTTLKVFPISADR